MPWGRSPNPGRGEQVIPPRYIWPFHRFDLPPEAIFNDLHQRFNTTPIFIQDFDSFFADVNEIAHEAESRADLYKRLEIRRDQRVAEVREAMLELRHHRNSFDAFRARDWGHFRQLMLHGTLGHLVRLIASLLESRNTSPTRLLSRSPSPFKSEDALTQHEPDEIMGIGPAYSSQWTWETSAEREERMIAEGKIILRQAPTASTEHPTSRDPPTTEGRKGTRTHRSLQRQPESFVDNSTETGLGDGKPQTGRKARRNQGDAENGSVISPHEIEESDQQQPEPVEEPGTGRRNKAKRATRTLTRKNSHATNALDDSEEQEPQTASTSTRPRCRTIDARASGSEKKRKRAVDDEPGTTGAQTQLNGEPSPQRRVKAKIAKAKPSRRTGPTTTESSTAERARPRRSARLSSSR